MEWKQKAKETIMKIQQGKRQEVIRDIVAIEEQLKKIEELSTLELLFLHYTAGLFYKEEKNYALASHHFQQTMKYRPKDKETEQLYIQAHLSFATLDESTNQLKEAKMTLARLLQYLEKHQFDERIIAKVYQKIGWLFYKEDELHQAHTQLEQAKQLLEKSCKKTDPEMLQLLDKLAEIYIALEQPEKAVALFTNIVDASISKEACATIKIKIGELNFHIDLRIARKTIIEAIELVDETHPIYLRGNMLLAEIEENIVAYPRAVKYYKRAFDHVVQTHEKTHFLHVFLLSKLGTIHLKMGELDKAQSYLEDGLPYAKAYEKIEMQYFYALGKIYSDKELYDKAFDMYTNFLFGLEQEEKTNTLAYGNTLQALAYNYLRQEEMQLALARYSEALQIYSKLGSNCRNEKGLAAIRLGYCYEQLEELEKAEDMYKQGIADIERAKDADLMEEAYMAIITFYQKTNQLSKLPLYENKIVKLQKQSI
ncbi:tetratricopeptide repeat protein [Gracilibacillus marinus]|uniref:Tetratricopeptide repeat protein n=1 Tax=Gracilibacillus marinus TaxID=630535 RepID=A0ABV8VR86_9BACI